jgi:DNA-binding transcriptional LysR family regulator
MRVKWILILVFSFLTACGNQTLGSGPPVPELWKVNISSSLGWIGPTLNTCTLAQQGKGIIIVDEGDVVVPDITLQWNSTPPSAGFIAQIGWDELSIVVHSDNPLQFLTIQELQTIFNGKIRSWQALPRPGLPSGNIEVWINPSQEESSKGFLSIFSSPLTGNPQSVIAPNPSTMRQAISSNPLAIGYLPARWVDNTVHAVQIEGVPSENLRLPILAIFPQEPSGAKRGWLLCLQEAIRTNSQP